MIRGIETPLQETALVMEEVTDPAELARAHAQHERFQRNLTWFETHALALGEKYRGKCICIAGEELFVAGDEPEAHGINGSEARLGFRQNGGAPGPVHPISTLTCIWTCPC